MWYMIVKMRCSVIQRTQPAITGRCSLLFCLHPTYSMLRYKVPRYATWLASPHASRGHRFQLMHQHLWIVPCASYWSPRSQSMHPHVWIILSHSAHLNLSVNLILLLRLQMQIYLVVLLHLHVPANLMSLLHWRLMTDPLPSQLVSCLKNMC